jgi:dinuclear metal center YbgI/SA1388 family protein
VTGQRTDHVCKYLDGYLNTSGLPDSSRAWNGLQVANGGTVSRVAAAVDASQDVIDEAARRRCDLLLVHHGLFWDGGVPITGRRYRRLRVLLQHDIALYSAHLPLDVHPEVGNNAVLARELGIEADGTLGRHEGVELGVTGTLAIGREALTARLEELLGGGVRLIPGGGEAIRRVGVVTGGAGSMIGAAVAAGVDAFITGEGPHHTYFDAMEGGINVYYAGHYATETWGVRALAAHLEEKFGIPWEFIDRPTGL